MASLFTLVVVPNVGVQAIDPRLMTHDDFVKSLSVEERQVVLDALDSQCRHLLPSRQGPPCNRSETKFYTSYRRTTEAA